MPLYVLPALIQAEMSDSLKIIVPSSLSPDGEILEGLSKQTRVREKASHFISRLYTSWRDEDRGQKYIPISSKLCRNLYSRNGYEKITHYLVRHGIVERDDSYHAGTTSGKGKCKGWRLMPEYEHDPAKFEISDPSLLTKLRDERAGFIAEYSPVIQEMEMVLRMISFREDFSMENFLESKTNEMSHHAKVCALASSVKIEDGKNDLVNTIKKGSKGRYFHKLNNCNKLLRRELIINGETSSEVDVVNCQPLLMAFFLNDANMIDVCSKGQFYEEMMSKCSASLSRDEMKLAILRDVIGKCPRKGGHEYWKGKPADVAFMQAFPDAYKATEELRARNGDLFLIHNLQRTESDMIHGIVLPSIQKAKINAVSIHDALTVPESKVEEVKDKMQKGFLKQYGTKVSIST